jgi:hypothetical protein
MNELAEQVQQAYDRGGREEARRAILRVCEERDWTRDELSEAFALYRSYPTT